MKSEIIFGLSAIKGVGDGPIEIILKSRGNKPFKDLDDFCKRVNLQKVGKKSLEALVLVGALDEFGNRKQLFQSVPALISESKKLQKSLSIGQTSFFDTGHIDHIPNSFDLPDIAEYPKKELIKQEKELVGTYLSEHPLEEYRSIIDEVATIGCGDVDDFVSDREEILVGQISLVKRLTTRNNEPMAFAKIEDFSGTMELVIFPRVYNQVNPFLREDNIVAIYGILVDQAKHKQEQDRIQIQVEECTDNISLFKGKIKGRQPTKETLPEPKPVVKPPPKPELKEEVVIQQETKSFNLLSLKRKLEIIIPTMGDKDKKISLLHDLVSVIKKYPGNDKFAFTINNTSYEFLYGCNNSEELHDDIKTVFEKHLT